MLSQSWKSDNFRERAILLFSIVFKAAADLINNFVAEKTHEKIMNLINLMGSNREKSNISWVFSATKLLIRSAAAIKGLIG